VDWGDDVVVATNDSRMRVKKRREKKEGVLKNEVPDRRAVSGP
jgi:hypothetical protein